MARLWELRTPIVPRMVRRSSVSSRRRIRLTESSRKASAYAWELWHLTERSRPRPRLREHVLWHSDVDTARQHRPHGPAVRRSPERNARPPESPVPVHRGPALSEPAESPARSGRQVLHGLERLHQRRQKRSEL